MQESYIELSKIRTELDRLWNRGGVNEARETNIAVRSRLQAANGLTLTVILLTWRIR